MLAFSLASRLSTTVPLASSRCLNDRTWCPFLSAMAWPVPTLSLRPWTLVLVSIPASFLRSLLTSWTLCVLCLKPPLLVPSSMQVSSLAPISLSQLVVSPSIALLRDSRTGWLSSVFFATLLAPLTPLSSPRVRYPLHFARSPMPTTRATSKLAALLPVNSFYLLAAPSPGPVVANRLWLFLPWRLRPSPLRVPLANSSGFNDCFWTSDILLLYLFSFSR
jgi:hypothetical protein